MKITFVTKSLLNGGAETNVCDLSEWFARRGAAVEVVVLSSSCEANVARVKALGIRVVELQETTPLRMLLKLCRHLRSCSADVVHAHMPLAIQACRLLRPLLRAPLVTTEHNVWERVHFLHRLVAPVLHHADALSLACSTHVAASFPYALAANENGRHFGQFDEDAEAPWPLGAHLPKVGSLIYLNVANVNAKKDHIHLLRSFQLVPPVVAGRKTFLLIAGARGDSWDEVRRHIVENRMEGRAFLLGPRSDVAVLMRHADAFVLSSRHEGLPLAVLEAMYLGLPIVCTAVGELPRLLAHTNWVVPDRSPASFASAMVSIVTDASTAGLVEMNKRLARDGYSIDRQADELEGLYRRLIRSRARGASTLRAETSRDPSASVIVVSKPYQALMALSVLEVTGERAAFFVVKRSFAFAESFFRFMKAMDAGQRIDSVSFVDGYDDLMAEKGYIRGRKLYVEDDRVSLYLFFRRLEPASLWLFEEGFGTYHGNYADLRPGWRNKARYLKWWCYSLVTGCGLHFGGGRETRGIFCTNPALYRRMNPSCRKPLIQIRKLDAYSQFFRGIVEGELGAIGGTGKAVVFLGPWGGGYDTLQALPRDDGSAFFYKAHPHSPVREPGKLCGFQELNIQIPAEYQIDYLAERFASTHVYHFSSTAALHEYGKDNIVFHDLARDKRYVALENALRECK